MTNVEKIIDVAKILDSQLSVEQKLAAVRLVLQAQNAQQDRPLRSGWQRDDDPDVRGRQ